MYNQIIIIYFQKLNIKLLSLMLIKILVWIMNLHLILKKLIKIISFSFPFPLNCAFIIWWAIWQDMHMKKAGCVFVNRDSYYA